MSGRKSIGACPEQVSGAWSARSFCLEICDSGSLSPLSPSCFLCWGILTFAPLAERYLGWEWGNHKFWAWSIFSLLSLGARVLGCQLAGEGRVGMLLRLGKKSENRGRETQSLQGILFPKCNLKKLQPPLPLHPHPAKGLGEEAELEFEVLCIAGSRGWTKYIGRT